jgi:chromosome segregation ATPase
MWFRRFAVLSVVVALGVATGLGPAAAQERRSAGDQALKRAQYMLRLLNEENAELEAQVAALEDEKSDLAEEVEALEAEVASAESRLADARQQIDELVERIRSDVEKFQALRARYVETARELDRAEHDNDFLVEAVREREQWVDQCQQRNADLYTAGQEILDRYKTLALGDTEGVFGFRRVRLQNEVQTLRFRLEDLQVTQYVPTRDILPFIRRGRDQAEAQPGGAEPGAGDAPS